MVDNLFRIGMSDGPNLGVIGLSFAGLFVMFDKELTSIFSSPQAHKASLPRAKALFHEGSSLVTYYSRDSGCCN